MDPAGPPRPPPGRRRAADEPGWAGGGSGEHDWAGGSGEHGWAGSVSGEHDWAGTASGEHARPGTATRTPPPARRSRRGVEGPVAPVRRLLSVSVAALAALLAAGLILGAQTARVPYAVVVFAVQVLFVVAWTVATRPPAPRVVAGVGIATAAVADAGAVWPQRATLAPLGLAMVAGVLLSVVGQLSRRSGRVRVTESFSSALVVVLGVVAYAALIVLTRQPLGTQAIVACLAAAGAALVVARLTDVVWSSPRTAPAVPRGAGGIVFGAMVGTGAAAVLGSYLVGLSPRYAAVAGLATALVAVMSDLAVGYAEAGRRLAGEAPTLWLARHMQGPLVAFALAAPVAYLMSVLVLIPELR